MKNRFYVLLSVVALCCVYNANVAVALSWDPLTDAGANLIGWYDASDGDTVITNTSASSNVLKWDDKSANGYHMTSGDRPSYGTYTINGLKCINLTGTMNQMSTNLVTGIDCTNICLISVIEPKAAGDFPSGGYIANTDASDFLELRGQNDNISGKTSCSLKLDGSSISMSTANTTNFVDDVPLIIGSWYDGFNGVARINGGTVSVTTDAADGRTFTINRIQCGRQSGTPRNYHGEMIVLNAADIDTIEKVEGYLAHKWTLYSSLPTNHPYRYHEPNVPIPFGALSVSNITTTSADLYVEAETNLTSATVVWDTSDKGKTNLLAWAGSNSASGSTPGTISGAATNLAADTAYFFRFYGEDGTTNGWSIPLQFSTPITANQAPAFTVASTTWNSVTLGWSDNAATETGYVLQRSTNGTTYAQIAALNKDVTTYVDRAVVHGRTYYYRLAATNSVNATGTDPSACQTNATPALTGSMIFGENFEDPVVSGDVDTTPTGWASAVVNKAGLNNGAMTGKTGNQFARIDNYPNPPMYNGALTTTASILTNKLTSCFHYTLTCDTTGAATTDAVTIDLLAGATVVASVTKSIATPNNLSANKAQIDFIPQADHPNLGETLAIRLRQVAGDHNQPCYFDNLSLSADDTALDTDPPTPNPMTWVQTPVPAGNLSMLMTCAVASDTNFVEYCFTNTVNGHSSGWLSVTTWRDTGLEHGVQYSFMAKARDTSFNKNETDWSTVASATADEGVLFYDSFERPVVSSDQVLTDPYQWQDLSTGANLRAGLGYLVGYGYTGMKGNQAAWLNVYSTTPVLKTTTNNLNMQLVEGAVYTLTFLAADNVGPSLTYVMYGDLMAGTNLIMTASITPTSQVFSNNRASNTVTVASGTVGIKETLSIRLRVTGGEWNKQSYVDDLRLYAVLPPPSGTVLLLR